jgi:hypothetical protein
MTKLIVSEIIMTEVLKLEEPVGLRVISTGNLSIKYAFFWYSIYRLPSPLIRPLERISLIHYLLQEKIVRLSDLLLLGTGWIYRLPWLLWLKTLAPSRVSAVTEEIRSFRVCNCMTLVALSHAHRAAPAVVLEPASVALVPVLISKDLLGH